MEKKNDDIRQEKPCSSCHGSGEQLCPSCVGSGFYPFDENSVGICLQCGIQHYTLEILVNLLNKLELLLGIVTGIWINTN